MNNAEEQFYEIAAQEVALRSPSPEIMARALAEAGGDEKTAVRAYIRLRVHQLRAEHAATVREAGVETGSSDSTASRESIVHWLAFVGPRALVGVLVAGVSVGIMRAGRWTLNVLFPDELAEFIAAWLIAVTLQVSFLVYFVQAVVYEAKRRRQESAKQKAG